MFSHFFIDRPRFAIVVSSLIVVFGIISYLELPVAQYPEIAPPQIQVRASYPGANAETIAATVAAPLEEEINGVEGMIYMSSQATNDGVMTLSISFTGGTNIDTAQILVQNRVSAALPRLPEVVQRNGVTTKKSSPDMLLVVNLYSPGGTYDQNYIGNYASLEIIDRLNRLDGIGDSRLSGASDYSMRIWLDPDRLALMQLSASDVLDAIRSQNVQVAGGTLNQSPVSSQQPFEMTVQTQGRLADTEDFEDIIIKSGRDGRLVKFKDVARVELGAENYATRGYLGSKPAVSILLFARPGSNALATATLIKETLASLSKDFPADLDYRIDYNPTEYIAASVDEVVLTLFMAMLLVVLVILVFLQNWRTAIIPVAAIPISLIGTFGVMYWFGYSLNMLSLFGLVLAIGIVVDDAIVVVESVQKKLSEGLDVVTATKQTMNEVGSALVATSLVLVAVFLPTVLMDGITGQFYKQFGVTIAAATMISTLISLTLSPALAAILMKPTGDATRVGVLDRPARAFNRLMDWISQRYGKLVAKLVRLGVLISILYIALIAISGYLFLKIPTGFIPPQDQGYVITAISLPPGASLDRTDAVVKRTVQALVQIPGVKTTVAFAGFSGATFTNSSNAGAIFTILDPLAERRPVEAILSDIRQELSKIDDAFIIALPPPPIKGIGTSGGFKMMIQDLDGQGPSALAQASRGLIAAANSAPETTGVYTFFETDTPRVYLDIDRERARNLNVPMNRIFDELELHLGSAYVNDFDLFGRSFHVTAQADAAFRLTEDDVLRLRVKNSDGYMVPLGSIATIADASGPSRVVRYNLYPAVSVSGRAAQGYSSGQALARMEQLALDTLPEGFGFEWTELAYQEKATGNTAIIIFSLAVLFVFLLLSAQYESWTLPLAIILIVPMCLLSAGAGLLLSGMNNDILTQVGLIVLVGLASKNAILIVEFAKQEEESNGATMRQAAITAAVARLRPILMTSLSFILGVMPLLFSTGPGFEMRQAIGMTVFSGMVGVTVFGLLYTPVFYVLFRKLAQQFATADVEVEELVRDA